MWFAEFQFDGSDSPVGSIAKKFNISLSTYPISFIEEKNRLLIYFACNIYGSEENKKAALKSIAGNSLVHFIEENRDFLIVLFEEPKKTKEVYKQNIIHSRPIFISHEGKETWSVASKNRVSMVSGRVGLRPRCLELFDHGSLDLVRPEAGGLQIPAAAGAAVFFEEEVPPDESLGAMERWYAAIENAGGLADDTVVAQSEAEQAELKRLRHALPAGMNERGARVGPQGGRKVSTDFAVPLEKLPQMMEEAYAIVRETFGGFHVAYGHAGNGHPHFNLLAEDAAGLTKAREAAGRMAERALDLGGTLAAEHGIGKVKSALYRRLYPAWLVEASLGVKRALDPQGILSPGNIFGEDEV